MATLAEIAAMGDLSRGPDIVGAASRGAVTGGQLAQLAQMQREQQAAETVDRLLAEGAAAPGMRQEAISEAARTGGALGASGLIDAFSALDAPEQERQAREAAILAQEMAGVTDQATWDAARARLAANPNVDITDLPAAFDPNLRMSIINGAREVSDIFQDVRSPEAQAQAIERAQAGRAQGGTTIINAGPQGQDFGEPPKDTVWARNPDNSIAVRPVTLPDGTEAMQPIAVPIVGGTVEREDTAAAEAAAAREERNRMTSDIVVQDIGRARDLVQNQSFFDPVTGVGGAVAQAVPGSARSNAEALIETIGANIGLDRLQRMREESPTGGALGNVTEGERAALQATLGSLSLRQEDQQLIDNMDRLEVLYLETVHGGDAMEILQMPLSELSQYANRVDQMTLAEQRALELRLDRLGVE